MTYDDDDDGPDEVTAADLMLRVLGCVVVGLLGFAALGGYLAWQ